MTKQYGILVDIASCLGCGVCVLACKQENNLPPDINDMPGTIGIAWNQVLSFLEGTYPELSVNYLYAQCMHCGNPPCKDSCPKGAIYKRDDGLVLIDKDKCDGCKDLAEGPKCVPACPYGTIQFSDKRGIAEKCTLCSHLIDASDKPACVKACLGDTLIFGDFNDPSSKVSKKIEEAGDRVFILKPEEKAEPFLKYIRPEGVGLDRLTRLDKARKLYGFEKRE